MTKKQNINLVKTDYDNFRDMAFFIKQQKKANEMLREVEEFKQSFLDSKMISYTEFIQKNPLYTMNLFGGIKEIIIFKPSKESNEITKAFIKINKGNHRFFWDTMFLGMSPSIQSSSLHYLPDNAVKQGRLSKEQICAVNRLYFAEYADIDIDYTTGRLTKEIHHKKSEVNEKDTLWIIDDSIQFINKDFIKQDLKKEYSHDVKYRYIRESSNYFAVYYNLNNFGIKYPSDIIIDETAVISYMENRFKDACDIIKSLYTETPEKTAKLTYDKAYGNPEEKHCVIWKGEPMFISSKKYVKAEISDDEKTVSFWFDRDRISGTEYNEYIKHRSWVPERIKLTYDVKTNELINIEKYL